MPYLETICIVFFNDVHLQLTFLSDHFNHFCAVVLSDCPCDMDHESEANAKIKK